MGRLHPNAHFLDVHLANGHSPSPATATSTCTYNGISSHIPLLRLQPREDSTRVQLQRQRLRDQQATQLVSASIPGLKTSAAFFASLRTNLRLHASPPPSPISTPNSMRGSAASLPPPSPLSGPADSVMDDDGKNDAMPEDLLAGVPELSSYLATNEPERTEALKLVADSVAQQRQASNRALIFHPLNLALLVGLVALASRYMLDLGYDIWIVGTTWFGFIMTGLAFCRFATQGYIKAAEAINWEWLGDADIFVTKFGDEVIGTVMIEWVSGESTKKKGKKAWRGFIRAWTVKLRYRGKGVGGALLEDAVKEAKKKSAESLEFADDHANATRILPSIYNRAFDKGDEKSRDMLQDLLETSPSRSKKR